MNTNISKVENKTPNHAKYITTQEFNKLTKDTFTTRLRQADLLKTDFDDKLTGFNKLITSNKTNHLEVQKKLNSLITKYHNFFFGRIYFTSNDGFQITFGYQQNLIH